MSESILPPGATKLERSLEEVITAALEVPNDVLWNPALCPSELLPWLAHNVSVIAWEPEWSEDTKRAVIASSVEVHRRNGTIFAIREAMASQGFGEVSIVESMDANTYNGEINFNGVVSYGTATSWAEYSIFLTRPITINQAAQVRRLLSETAPARCRLRKLEYYQAANLYNGAILYDGTFSHGAA